MTSMTTSIAAPLIPFQVGDFVAELLWTDTLVFEVVAVTPRGIRVRRTSDADRRFVDKACDKGAFGLSVEWVEQVADEHAPVRQIRLRKDGTLRTSDSASPMRPATTRDGVPVRRIDHRF